MNKHFIMNEIINLMKHVASKPTNQLR